MSKSNKNKTARVIVVRNKSTHSAARKVSNNKPTKPVDNRKTDGTVATTSRPIIRRDEIDRSAQTPVVEIVGLCKKYSKKADYAVRDVSFCCYAGEIVGLLGHNGAGKSTTLKCLEGMLPFEEGQIRIDGHDIRKEPIAAKANMGFVTDNHAVFVKMTGMEYLSFMSTVYKVPQNVRRERYEQLEKVFCLGDAVNNLISSYSHGMRQKICMMGSLMHQPRLWILDEPLTGLDPRTMKAVREYMKDYAAKGNCIIFSSHALANVAQICDRVVLIRRGQQIDALNIRQIMTDNPDFDFENFFLEGERQAAEEQERKARDGDPL